LCVWDGSPLALVLLRARGYIAVASARLPHNFLPNLTGLLFSLEKIVKGNGLVAISAFECFAALGGLKAHLHKVVHFVFYGDLFGVVLGPLSRFPVELFQVVLVHLGNHGVLRVIRLRGTKERLKRDECSADGQGWSPFVLQDI